ncbi:MAG: GTP-binding protein [Pyrinomonadaceae bacterium]|nr:GTP-binding protein [Pyrinomonadaceae bacterium]
MIQKKICMLGATGVGKTSLVRQFVQSIFSDKYHSTIGVKIDKKVVAVDESEVMMMLWDVQGEDKEFKVSSSFLKGASGFLLVVDLTRPETLDTANSILKMVEEEVGELQYLVLFNKNDLNKEKNIGEDQMFEISGSNKNMLLTSAKTGEMVEEAFVRLARRMI